MWSPKFVAAVSELRSPQMGTEHVAPLLYSLVRMIRPRSALEIGLGYTTPFLLQALRDNIAEHADDRKRLQEQDPSDPRLEVLLAEADRAEYRPRLQAIDDLSDSASTAALVQSTVEALELDDLLDVHTCSFRGLTRSLPQAVLPLDFVWFDCGGPEEYADFLAEYWSSIRPDGGVLVLHYTYWHMPTVQHRRTGAPITSAPLEPSPMLDEIKRQHVAQGAAARFELASMVEPHKSRQGSVTLIRRIDDPAPDPQRDMTMDLEDRGFAGPYTRFRLE